MLQRLDDSQLDDLQLDNSLLDDLPKASLAAEAETVSSPEFDWQFYVEYHLDLQYIASREEAYQHWIEFGLPEQRCGSELEFYRRLRVEPADLPAEFDYRNYLTLNPDVEQFLGDDRYSAIQHFLTQGQKERREYDLTSPRAHHQRGILLAAAARWEEAIAAYDAAIELQPDYAAYHDLGLALMQLQEWDAARDAFEQAIALDAAAYDSHYCLGKALEQLEDWSKAVAVYQRCLKMESVAAAAEQRLRDIEANEAIDLDEILSERDPEFDWRFYLTYYADLQHLSGYKAAYQHWIYTGKLEGRCATETSFYTQIGCTVADLPADFDPQSYLDLNPDVKETFSREGFSKYDVIRHFLTQGRLEKREYDATSPAAYYNLGNLLAALGQWDAAVQAYHQVLTLCPQPLEVKSAASNSSSKNSSLKNSSSENRSEYFATVAQVVQVGTTWIRNGLASVVSEQLLAGIEISPPRLCAEAESILFPPELLLLQTLACLDQAIPSAQQISLLDLYYRRIDPRYCQRQIYSEALQPLLVWAHNQIFCRYMNVAATEVVNQPKVNQPQSSLQKLLGVLCRITSDCYGDLHLARNLAHCGSFQPDDPNLLRLAAVINHRLGNHYEAVIAASQYFQTQQEDANLYTLVANSAIEVVHGSLPLMLNSIEQISTWLTTAFTLHPASSRPRQLLDVALMRFASRAISATREVGMQTSLTTALQLRQTALEQLNDHVQRRAKLLQTATGMPDALPVRPSFGQVLVVGNHHIPQCYYYRVKQKLDHLGVSGLKPDFMDSVDLGGLQWQQRMMEVDTVILCRLPATFEVLRFIHYARSLGVPVLYDIDDLMFDEAHFPAPLDAYAGTIDRSTHVHLTLDNPLFRVAMVSCDAVIVSTQALAEQVQGWVAPETPVWVYPNLMGDELVSLAEALVVESSQAESLQAESSHQKALPPVRLFYGSGTKAHKQLFYEILVPALLDLLAKHEQLELHLVGHFELPEEMQVYQERIVVDPFISDYSAYLYELHQADISLSILEDSAATDCKSEIKWLEAAAFGIPSVLSPTATYRQLLEDGTEALFAQTTADWFAALDRLIVDKALRQQMGAAARERAWIDYSSATGQRCMTQVLQPPAPRQLVRRRKRLLVVNVFFAPQSIGGATRVAETQVRHLLEQHGDEYELYVLCAENDPGIRAPYEVEQYGFGSALVTKLYVPGRDWADHQDGNILDFCRRFYRSYQFDLIHFHCVQMLTAAVVDAAHELRIPYLVTAHDAWWLSRHQFLVDEEGNAIDPQDPWSGISGRTLGLKGEQQRQHLVARRKAELERRNHLLRCLRQARAVLAVSESFAQIYRAVGLTNVMVNENGIEPLQVLPKVPSSSGKLRVAHIGGVSKHKGFHLFREALERGEFTNLEAIVIDHSLEPGEILHEVWGTTPVTLKPKVKQKEISQLYSEIDVLVAPSIWPESYGLVTREALAAGVWVIASDRGAIGADVEEGVNGNVVNVEDCVALQSVLRAIDQNYPLGLNRTNAGASQFRDSVEQMKELTQIYREFL